MPEVVGGGWWYNHSSFWGGCGGGGGVACCVCLLLLIPNPAQCMNNYQNSKRWKLEMNPTIVINSWIDPNLHSEKENKPFKAHSD